MAVSLVVDDTSLVLLLAIIVLLSASIWISRAYQPLIHPLILSRQADVSQVRHKGQSAIYRNANAPVGFELAARPRRGINDVRDIVQQGIASQHWSFDAPRRLYGQTRSNADFVRESTSFGQGLAALAGLASTSNLCLAVCVERDSLQSLEAVLSGCLQDVQGQRYVPIVVAPAYASHDEAPSNLPASSSATALSAIFTTRSALERALDLALVDPSTIVVVPGADDVVEARKLTNNSVVAFADVLAAAATHSLKQGEHMDKDTSGEQDSVQSIYWTGKTAGWIEVTHSSLLSGLTAQLGFYPADAIPTFHSHVFVEQPSSLDDSASLRLGAASTPAGLALALVTLYTGASLTVGLLTSSLSGRNPLASEQVLHAKPDMIYASPTGASALAAALSTATRRSSLSRAAVHAKLAALRHGALSNDGLGDRLVFAKSREQAGCSQLKSLIVVGEGPVVPQALLDNLRLQLGCPVMQSYLPLGHLLVHGSHITAGVRPQEPLNRVAALTAPIATTHALDLQAFASDDHHRPLPAHSGPPSVALEVKLVETAKAKGLQVVSDVGSSNAAGTHAGQAQDPVGEIFVRGPCLTGHTDASSWCATGDVGTFRSNGTLVVLRNIAASEMVDAPTFSAKQPPAKRAARTTPHVLTTLMAALCLFLSCVGTVAALAPSSRSLYAKRDGASPNDTLVDTAIMGMLSSQRASWEHGVAQTALLEMRAGQWSVFAGGDNGAPYRPGQLRPQAAGLSPLIVSMSYNSVRAQDRLGKLCARVTGDENATEGSALDPASCGDGVLMAAFASGEISETTAAAQGFWISAASNMLDYLLYNAPKAPNGAISHRSTGVVYWSDGIFMGPPFLALYGLMTNNQTLLQMAFDQCRLYRDALRIPSGDAQGLLRHIVNATGTEGNDPGAWLTGLGWASAGMLRVLATITQSSFNTQMADQTANLVSWVEEILDGAYKFANPLMRNYVNDSDAFYDIAGSSLVAYSTYRLASIAPDSGATAHVAGAEAIYNTVKSQLSPFGFFTPPLQVVDALSFTSPGDTSPESLAFVVLLEAARRDHDQKNVTSLHGPSSASTSSKDGAVAKEQRLRLVLAGAALASVVSLLVSLL